MKNLLLTLAIVGAPAVADAILLDSFDVPYSRAISSGTYVDTIADPGFFGGHRDVMIQILDNTGTGSLRVDIANGKLTMSSDPGVTGIVWFQYDGTGEPPSNTGPDKTMIAYEIPGQHPLGDGTHSLKVHIDDAQFRRGIGVQLDLYRNGVLSNVISRNPARGSSILTIGPNPVIFAINKAVGFDFQFVDGGDSIVVDKTEIVPEPGTFLGLAGALGGVGLLRLRRRP